MKIKSVIAGLLGLSLLAGSSAGEEDIASRLRAFSDSVQNRNTNAIVRANSLEESVRLSSQAWTNQDWLNFWDYSQPIRDYEQNSRTNNSFNRIVYDYHVQSFDYFIEASGIKRVQEASRFFISDPELLDGAYVSLARAYSLMKNSSEVSANQKTRELENLRSMHKTFQTLLNRGLAKYPSNSVFLNMQVKLYRLDIK